MSELLNARGVRDFLPEEAIARQGIISTIRDVFELFGFSPMETPAIERKEILTAKFAGGSEILKELFTVTDQGGRDLGLRYDLTVPFSKVVGMNPNLNLPFKRYQIQPVWRDGPIKLGRYREFLQCDADVVGSGSMLADAEILAVAERVFSELRLPVAIKVNSRKLMNGIMASAGIEKNRMEAILSIDKLGKFGIKTVKEELEGKGFGKETGRLLQMLEIKGKNEQILEKISKLVNDSEGMEGIEELKQLLKYCSLLGLKNIEIDISLARGLEYYTGPVFEVFSRDGKITSSLAGGGRYDKMIGLFLGKGEYPATGISFGIEPIFELLKLSKKADGKRTVTSVFVIPINTEKESLKLVTQLRKSGVRAETDLIGRSISKNLAYANSLGIPWVIFLGKDELAKKKLKLRDMKSGKERMLTLPQTVKALGVN